MKSFNIFFALFIFTLLGVASAQDVIRGSILADGSSGSDTSASIDISDNGIPQFQVWIKILGGTSKDTLRVLEYDTFASSSKTLWSTVMVYNPHVSETPDSLVYVTSQAKGDSVFFTKFLLQSPILRQIRIVRERPRLRVAPTLYYEIWTRRYEK